MTGIGSVARSAVLAVVTALGALPAAAATMTFEALPDEGAWVLGGRPDYTENGITASGTPFKGRTPGVLPVLDFGTQWSSIATFTTGGLFDAVSFDFTGSATLPYGATPVANVILKGFLGGTEVATDAFALGGPTGGTYLFGGAFAGIDQLVISVIYGYGTPNPFGCAPCTRMQLDNLTLAPVPLPATALLLGGALGLGAFAARRRISRKA